MEIKNDAQNFIDYSVAFQKMQDFAVQKCELVWLLQHNDIYTIGGTGDKKDILDSNIPVFVSNRGGKVTYHGPGQLVCYLVLDIKARFQGNIRAYINFIEDIILNVLKSQGVNGFLKDGLTGIWVKDNNIDAKIAAIGVRVTNGFTLHGFSININTDLSKFNGIIPCGIKDFGVTSLHKITENKIDITDIALQILKDIQNKLAF